VIELETQDFRQIIHRIEIKGSSQQIYILKMQEMKEARKVISLKNRAIFDDMGNYVITSREIVAAKTIQRFLKRKKEKLELVKF
jgi:hypothetical protein